MLREHLHLTSHRVSQHDTHPDEHRAVVELLVLVVFADSLITQDELDALDQFDCDHADWDDGDFSVRQYLGQAISKVREVIDDEEEVTRLIRTNAGRIESPELRHQTPLYCRELASVDGRAHEESAMLAEIFRALS